MAGDIFPISLYVNYVKFTESFVTHLKCNIHIFD